MSKLCECASWCRADISFPYGFKDNSGHPIITNHHPKCPRYNDSLIDCWIVKEKDRRGSKCYFESRGEAEEFLGEIQEESGDDLDEFYEIIQSKIHKEILNNMAEFDGF